MRPQKIGAIKASLHDMNLEELKEMSDDLASLIEVLVTRQEAVESTIVDRLAATFEKWHLKKKTGTSALLNLPTKLLNGVKIRQQKLVAFL